MFGIDIKRICKPCFLWLQEPTVTTVTEAPCEHHVTPVTLRNGRLIYASAYRSASTPAQAEWPTIGVYLASQWLDRPGILYNSPALGFHTPPTDKYNLAFPVIYLPWQDYGVVHVNHLGTLVSTILRLVENGERVEIGCAGGHGRTGTVLAALLIAQGSTATAALDNIHTQYCKYAVETLEQLKLLDEYEQVVNRG